MKDLWLKLRHSLATGEWRQLLTVQLEVKPYLQAVPYLLAAVLVGIWAVVYSGAFSGAIHIVQQLEARHPYWLLVLAPLAFGTGCLLVTQYAPEAAGAGTPQVNRALGLDPILHEDRIHSLLNLRVALLVAGSSLLAVLGAGSLGREGPMVHMGACLFYVTGRFFRRFLPEWEPRSWIVAGGAAGVAAAFNAPLAGVVFALEELSQQHFHRFKTAVIWAAILAGAVSHALTGKYLYLGYPKIGDVPLSSLPWAVLVGVLCGAMAYPFRRLTDSTFPSLLSGYFKTKAALAFFIGLVVASFAIFVNAGTLGGGTATIEDLLFENGRAEWSLVFGRFFTTALSALAGTAGGLLAPALSLGGAVGSKLAVLTDYPNHNLMVMTGMSAFLSAVVGAPFTAWVIVMEMTDRHSAVFPLMVASVTAFGTMRLLSERGKRGSDAKAPTP